MQHIFFNAWGVTWSLSLVINIYLLKNFSITLNDRHASNLKIALFWKLQYIFNDLILVRSIGFLLLLLNAKETIIKNNRFIRFVFYFLELKHITTSNNFIKKLINIKMITTTKQAADFLSIVNKTSLTWSQARSCWICWQDWFYRPPELLAWSASHFWNKL